MQEESVAFVSMCLEDTMKSDEEESSMGKSIMVKREERVDWKP
jgi:hypothetical protein